MILQGDCVQLMATLDAESVDAVVTDPPYDLLTTSRNGSRRINNPDNPAGRSAKGFMGKTWDGTGVAFDPATWAAAFRVAKPGAHLLAFGGTRTYHRLASAIEDAGWEIRDCLVWAYASGFPKSLDVSKAIDKAAGAEREVVGSNPNIAGRQLRANAVPYGGDHVSAEMTAPATPDAAKWDGWGTALKPAWEPIVMARKPLTGTVAANVLAHGTGALNIDATRIGFASDSDREGAAALQELRTRHPGGAPTYGGGKGMPAPTEVGVNAAGRWPANLILTDPIFDGGVDGVVGGGEAGGHGVGDLGRTYERDGRGFGSVTEARRPFDLGDTGTYSRFFLIPKAARSDREPVTASRKARANLHPTVKPVELMRHLVRLVTPPGGTVLDCFLGSGTTAIACELEGFAWIGMEKEPEYVAIAEARLNGTQRGIGL